MKVIAIVLLAASLLSAKENAISPQEAREGWLLLFDGETLFGWSQDPNGKWKAADGVLVFDAPEPAVLRSSTPFADFILRFDFRSPDTEKGSDIFLRAASSGNPSDNGYLLHHGNQFSGITKPENPAPSSGAWHTGEVEFVGDKFTIKLDGRKATEGKDARSKAGFIAIEGKAGAKSEYRNIRLKPLNAQKLFNGSELKGWKAVNAAPPKPSTSTLKKLLKLPAGTPKVKEAVWNLSAEEIHGSGGPGQLETEALYDDLIVQLDLRANNKKQKTPAQAAVYLRGEPGQLFSGYAVKDGALSSLKAPRRSHSLGEGFVTETIAARDRHFEIWVDGFPVTDYSDPRPDGASARLGPHTAAGSFALEAPAGEAEAIYRNISLASLPKVFGADMKAVAPPKPPPVPPADISTGKTASPVTPQPAPAIPPPSGNDTQFLQQERAREEQKKAEISSLTAQALKTTDLQQKVALNQQILTLEPSNLVALQNYNEAKSKIEAAEAQSHKQIEEQSKIAEKKTTERTEFSENVSKGKTALAMGNLVAARNYFSIADRLSPGNSEVGRLRMRVDDTLNFRQRLRYAATGAGAAALIGSLVIWWRSRGKKIPFLEVSEGIDRGKRYPLDQEVNHIGAIAQDGGTKNEIVVRDSEKTISRFHCEIHNQKGKLYLVDCESSNHTYLNGKRIEANKPVRLSDGARFTLGRTCTLRLGFEKQKKA